MHEHVHVENNIPFPRAARIAAEIPEGARARMSLAGLRARDRPERRGRADHDAGPAPLEDALRRPLGEDAVDGVRRRRRQLGEVALPHVPDEDSFVAAGPPQAKEAQPRARQAAGYGFRREFPELVENLAGVDAYDVEHVPLEAGMELAAAREGCFGSRG